MPIYEYECPKCGRFEVMQKHDDKPLKANPDCTEKDCPKKAVKLVSASAFHLKGGGWYKTDYSSSGKEGGGSSKKEQVTNKASTKSGDGTAASTPATTPPAAPSSTKSD